MALAGSSRSIARRILLLLSVLLVVLVASGVVLVFLDDRQVTDKTARERVSAIATTVASAPSLAQALTGGGSVAEQSARLQPYAEQVRAQTSADFVVIMRPDGIRLSHPDPANIGKTYLGSRAEALAGQTYLEVYTGTLGPSTRAITPVRDGAGTVVGLVSVGITQAHISDTVLSRTGLLAVMALFALGIGGIGAVLIARWVGRQTLGMGPTELARMYHYYDAVLDSVHEGMVLLDQDGTIVTVNPQGRRLLGLSEAAAGGSVTAAGVTGEVAALIDGQARVTDVLAVTDERLLVITKRSAGIDGHTVGSVVTLRDHTDIQALSGELDRVRGFTDALRAQAHESANRLHTVVSLIELGEYEDALAFAVDELSVAQALADQVVHGVDDRAVAALLLGKSAQGAERGIELQMGEHVDLPAGVADARELVTIIGNLIDNAFDAAATAAGPKWVLFDAGPQGAELVITVTDSGPGMSGPVAAQIFGTGFSTKVLTGPAGPRGMGLALVRQAVVRSGGSVTAQPGIGGCFVVRLPLPTLPTLATQLPLPTSPTSRSAEPDQDAQPQPEAAR